jgi:hypothetical protein
LRFSHFRLNNPLSRMNKKQPPKIPIQTFSIQGDGASLCATI